MQKINLISFFLTEFAIFVISGLNMLSGMIRREFFASQVYNLILLRISCLKTISILILKQLFFFRGKVFKRIRCCYYPILFKIGGFNRLISRIISLLPVKFRNILYKFISRNRYRFFGKQQDCMIPEEPIKKGSFRFILLIIHLGNIFI